MHVEGLGTKLCSWATCAIIIIYPTWLVLCCYYCKHICTCASVYSNFNIIYTQLCIKLVLQCYTKNCLTIVSSYFTHKFKAQIIFYANILEFPLFSDCPLLNPNPPTPLPSSTHVSSMQPRHISLIYWIAHFWTLALHPHLLLQLTWAAWRCHGLFLSEDGSVWSGPAESQDLR